MTSLAAEDHFEWFDADRHRAHTIFTVEGMRCAGCARSIERAVGALEGIETVKVNTATHRVSVDFDPAAAQLERIVSAVEQAGFRAVPLAGRAALAARKSERRTAIKRLGVAAFGMMQTMMLIWALYTAGPRGIDADYAHYFKLISMLITLPVLLYSGAPILRAAWAGLRARALGMDVPVALALLLAFAASVYHTLIVPGEVYYDSISMFVFFLLAGRFMEMNARHSSMTTSDALARSLPEQVTRLRADGGTERIPATQIAIGDRLQIAKGSVIPVDAVAASPTWINQSLLSGESAAVQIGANDRVPGGAVNVGAAVTVSAASTIGDSTLATIVQLLERAQRERPPIARAADRVAAWFVLAILVLALVVAAAWLAVDPSRAFSAVLAVLVVTCPCALSLATPVAFAAATTRLARDGVMVTRADAIERLSQIDTVVLDKTGTLTDGDTAKVTVVRTRDLPYERALALAAALERGSDHPLALAFARHGDLALHARDIVEMPGCGIEGRIGDRVYRLGRADYVGEIAGSCADESPLLLGDASGVLAAFTVADQVRPSAAAAIAGLRQLGLEVAIASGDETGRVAAVAQSLRVTDARGRLTPEAKIEFVQALRASGKRVLMLGDGINDGPVLAAADVSCAMGHGSAVAQAAADLLLIDDSLRGLARAIATARRTRAVLRQNLGWAFAYNVAAVPAAALGMVAPWLAALGMSLSSLAVVLNAQRLTRS
jgi:Cu2+-exporting ATPase